MAAAAERGWRARWAELGQNESHFRIALGVVACLALTLRLMHVFFLERTLAGEQIFDAAFYHDQARYLLGILTTPLEPGETRFANPGYPYVLAIFYAVFGDTARVAYVIQSVLGAASTVLLGLTARTLLDSRHTALIAALLWSLYAPAIHYDGSLLIPSITATLTIVALYATSHVLRALRDGVLPRAIMWTVLCGVSLGVCTLLRPTNALFGAALCAVMPFAVSQENRKKSLISAAILAASAAVVVTPWLLSQSAASEGMFVPISANGGMNFWVGNHAGATGIYDVAPFLTNRDPSQRDYTVISERNAYLEEAQRRTRNPALSLSESSAFWRDEALNDITSDVGAWMVLEARKLGWFLTNYEVRTNAAFSFLSRFSPVLRFDFLRFGLLMLTGALGLWMLAREQTRGIALVLGASVLVPLVVCLAFFVNGELRHPAAPALAIAAAYAISTLISGLRSDPSQYVIVRNVMLLSLAVATFYPVPEQKQDLDFKSYIEIFAAPRFDGRMPAREDYDHAEALLERMGDSYAERVIKQESSLLVYSNRAIQFQDMDAARKFVEAEKRLWALAPHPVKDLPEVTVVRVYFNLKRRLMQLASQPFAQSDATLEHDLALLGSHDYGEIGAYVRADMMDRAVAFVDEALAYCPSSVELMAHKGRLELMRGNEGGVRWLEKSFNGYPRKALGAVLLGEYFFRQGNMEQARMFLEQAMRREPQAPETQQLAQMLSGAN